VRVIQANTVAIVCNQPPSIGRESDQLGTIEGIDLRLRGQVEYMGGAIRRGDEEALLIWRNSQPIRT